MFVSQALSSKEAQNSCIAKAQEATEPDVLFWAWGTSNTEKHAILDVCGHENT